MGKLHWYVHQDPPPLDAATTSETLLYLEACNLLFEQGLLSHDRIRSMDSDVLNKGYSYFTAWLDSVFELGMPIHTNLYNIVHVPF